MYMLFGASYSLTFSSIKMLLEEHKRCLKPQLLEESCCGEPAVDDKKDMTSLDCVVQVDFFSSRVIFLSLLTFFLSLVLPLSVALRV